VLPFDQFLDTLAPAVLQILYQRRYVGIRTIQASSRSVPALAVHAAHSPAGSRHALGFFQ
jgi:hypothetical protein